MDSIFLSIIINILKILFMIIFFNNYLLLLQYIIIEIH